MKVYERVFEETYGGNHKLELAVDFFKKYNYLKLYKEGNNIIIRTTPVGFVQKKDFKVLEISQEELAELQYIATEVVL